MPSTSNRTAFTASSLPRLPKARLTKMFGDALETRYPGARLVGDPDIQDDRIGNVLSVTTSYIVPKLATEKDGNEYFEPKRF